MQTPPLELKLPGDTVSPLLIRYDIADNTYSVIKGTDRNKAQIQKLINLDKRQGCSYDGPNYYIIDFDRPYNIKPVETTGDVDISEVDEFDIAATRPLIVKNEGTDGSKIMSNDEYDKLKLDVPIENHLNNLYKQDGRPCIIDNSKGIIYYCVYFGVPKSFVVSSDVAADGVGAKAGADAADATEAAAAEAAKAAAAEAAKAAAAEAAKPAADEKKIILDEIIKQFLWTKNIELRMINDLVTRANNIAASATGTDVTSYNKTIKQISECIKEISEEGYSVKSLPEDITSAENIKNVICYVLYYAQKTCKGVMAVAANIVGESSDANITRNVKKSNEAYLAFKTAISNIAVDNDSIKYVVELLNNSVKQANNAIDSMTNIIDFYKKNITYIPVELDPPLNLSKIEDVANYVYYYARDIHMRVKAVNDAAAADAAAAANDDFKKITTILQDFDEFIDRKDMKYNDTVKVIELFKEIATRDREYIDAVAAVASGGSRHLKRSRKKGKDKKKATSTGNKKKSATKHKSKSKSKGKSKGNAT